MGDISGLGLEVQIVADTTFPAGFTITEFAADSDPLDMASIQIGDSEMGLNGDLITWVTANPLPAVVAVIPNTESDINLSILGEANRAGKGKRSAKDKITLIATYPDGKVVTMSGGHIRDAMLGDSVASAGKKKSKVYGFAFEGRTES